MKSGAPRDATLRRLALVIVTNSMGCALAMQKCFARGERGIEARAPRRKREAKPTAGAYGQANNNNNNCCQAAVFLPATGERLSLQPVPLRAAFKRPAAGTPQ